MMKSPRHCYEFGPFRLDPSERQLLRAGQVMPLTPKVFDTLLLFVENNNLLLTKDEMIGRLWPDSFVEESNLAQNVSMLRRALGEQPDVREIGRSGSDLRPLMGLPRRDQHYIGFDLLRGPGVLRQGAASLRPRAGTRSVANRGAHLQSQPPHRHRTRRGGHAAPARRDRN